ncbi:uncharacterized protein B0H18DRAFT_1043435 [Fomitopsis serialis]|uniref:uncharacterized protein n=1 Tax=Fomitopsis serialis TaxID=139415 RepID=UPI002007DE63|nr:uncharacterized protein B0H18DRAFT_1043435 [Neoantrodia serialis]KAH9914954.1 hypothetical protein B0H18DRAFT_1043435 [Neoantrodia serialis]
MSTSTAEAIASAQFILIQDYMGFACTVFPIYDYLLTVGSDINLLWLQRAPFGMTTLMVLIRFTIIGMPTIQLVSILCRGIYVSSAVFSQLPNILDAVISAIRAYAVSNRSLVWAAIVFSTGILVAIINAYMIATDRIYVGYEDGVGICDIVVHFVGSTSENVQLVALICNILSQAIVTGLTWSRMLFLVRRPGEGQARVNPRSFSISWFFLRDGTAYLMHVLLCPSTHAVFLSTLF